MDESSPMKKLLDTLPQVGRVEWIGVRPGRGEPMASLEQSQVSPEQGLDGDRYAGKPGSKRQVTLIQHEHLPVIAACAQRNDVSLEELPGLLRRNIVVSGVNLLALKGKRFRVGGAVLEYTGLCQPCSKMEAALGPGGYNAVRGHGGITATVVEAGAFGVGDEVGVV
ncbi:MOSC domain-containing protein [Algisphaera agarilytica]|uniref:MOSC domain-containing protein YiiM n=1 Tax=Algisphaera agarilytica TaxID=1385975 RepID=A0A7X0H679_9BACT|nr:MOSC domain-containing protein [Algisphaera agarilytica]MBB6428560.1 MOSC domain-containing protein YiiM [Algisphaera agarilytica]